MKIVKKQSKARLPRLILWAIVVLGALVAGIILGQSGFLTEAADLQTSWPPWNQRTPSANGSGQLPVIYVDMPFDNYNQILDQRQEALQQGVFLPAETDFVNADMRVEAQTIPVRMRLQPGAAQHLGDDEQWDFEVETRADQFLFEQDHFRLIDPADNNWLREWLFMANLAEEGLPAGRYQFARLILNGRDLGIYALQEDFGPLGPISSGHPPGPVIAYDVQPLWEAVRFFGGDLEAAIADPATNLIPQDFRYLEAEVQGDRDLVTDEALQMNMDQALASLRGLQRGEIPAAEVFDVQQYGRFLALVDFWGATGSLTPFNIAYYYHPENNRLVPIGRNGNPLANAARIPPEATYQDAALQAAYTQAAAEFSDPAYLEMLQTRFASQLDSLAQSLGREADPASLWADLQKRQNQLALSLEPAQPVLAHLDSPSLIQEGIIQVKVANALNLPVEVLGFDIGGATFLEIDPAWLVAGQEQVFPESGRVILRPAPGGAPFGLGFVSFNLPMQEIIAQDQELDFLGKVEIKVATRILGLERTQLTPARSSLPEESRGVQP